VRLFGSIFRSVLAGLVATVLTFTGTAGLPPGQSGGTWAGAELLHQPWSGTVATVQVPEVSGSWLSESSAWVGVGGAAGGPGLIQTGVFLTPVGDSAWWTTCGDWAGGNQCVPQTIDATVLPGDRIRMAVAQEGACYWRLSLTDMRGTVRAWWWGSTIDYCVLGARTVEWVSESWEPSTPVADYGTVSWSDIWLQTAPGRRWVPGKLRPADSLWSNWLHGISEERSGNPTICAAGYAAGRRVVVRWENACYAG